MSAHHHDPSRRRFVSGAMVSLGALMAAPHLRGAPLRPRVEDEDDDNLLVLVELGGGNDGLSTVVPYGDDAYHAARKVTHIETNDLFKIDDYRGLHPNLVNMHDAWQRGQFAIVEGCGYPNPNRSHFKSMEIWGTGSEHGRVYGDGWVGKLLTEKWGDQKLARRTVHIGAELPEPLMSSDHPVLCIESSATFRWAEGGDRVADVVDGADMMGERSMSSKIRSVLNNARNSSAEVRAAVARYEPSVEYPDSNLGEAMRTVAALMDGRIGCRILSVTLTGFDTHAMQLDVHNNLLKEVDEALGAFLKDIGRTERSERTLVMVYSEFGRRVAENASKGTDHGAAAPIFLVGKPVQGGLYGEHPSLTDLVDGDLIHNTDFRSVYATVIDEWMGVDPTRILPQDYPRIPFLA